MTFSLFGTSMPIAAFPGIGASIRISGAARFSLISSERPTILLTFTPISGCSSYLVTAGPQLIFVIVTLTPKFFNVCCSFMAVSCNCFLVSPCLFSACFNSVTGGKTYSFSGGTISTSISSGILSISFVCTTVSCCTGSTSSAVSSGSGSDSKSAPNNGIVSVSSSYGISSAPCSIPNAIAGSGRPGITNGASSATVREAFGSSICIGNDTCSSSAANNSVFAVSACPIASNASSENADGVVFDIVLPAVSVTCFSSLISGKSIISSGRISLISWERFCGVSGISFVSMATPSTFLSILRCCSRCSRSSLRISTRSL